MRLYLRLGFAVFILSAWPELWFWLNSDIRHLPNILPDLAFSAFVGLFWATILYPFALAIMRWRKRPAASPVRSGSTR